VGGRFFTDTQLKYIVYIIYWTKKKIKVMKNNSFLMALVTLIVTSIYSQFRGSDPKFENLVNQEFEISASFMDFYQIDGGRTIKYDCIKKLGEYKYESSVSQDYSKFKNKSVIIATFDVYSNELYRVIDLSTGFTQPVTINLYDADGKIFLSNKGDKNKKVFDFLASKTGTWVVEYNFSKQEQVVIKDKVVAFGIGYK